MKRFAPRGLGTVVLVAGLLGGCQPTGSAPSTGQPAASATRSATEPSATPIPTLAGPFPTAPFADISQDPVSEERAAEFQHILENMAVAGGMTATVMTAEGTWTGASGMADDVSDMQPDSQFGIASISKSLVAAQVMQLVEASELSLDDPATDRLPADFAFDTNGATIRQLLEHLSGIPDWYSDAMEQEVATDRARVWTTAEVLALVGPERTPTGNEFQYADTNYTLLGLVVEHVTGQPLVEVLRGGVLDVPGTERLVYQPDEAPTDPMAMPLGEPRTALEQGGGYLPSIADASSAGAAGGIASDSISLARWWRAFCAGEIVSEASLTEMSTFVGGVDGYGLGLFDVAGSDAVSIGHAGSNFGYVSWAGCLPEEGAVIVVLSTYRFDDIGGMAGPLIQVVRPELPGVSRAG
jgi:CubicO group peptidase (beta-lactamase class C family)